MTRRRTGKGDKPDKQICACRKPDCSFESVWRAAREPDWGASPRGCGCPSPPRSPPSPTNRSSRTHGSSRERGSCSSSQEEPRVKGKRGKLCRAQRTRPRHGASTHLRASPMPWQAPRPRRILAQTPSGKGPSPAAEELGEGKRGEAKTSEEGPLGGARGWKGARGARRGPAWNGQLSHRARILWGESGMPWNGASLALLLGIRRCGPGWRENLTPGCRCASRRSGETPREGLPPPPSSWPSFPRSGTREPGHLPRELAGAEKSRCGWQPQEGSRAQQCLRYARTDSAALGGLVAHRGGEGAVRMPWLGFQQQGVPLTLTPSEPGWRAWLPLPVLWPLPELRALATLPVLPTLLRSPPVNRGGRDHVRRKTLQQRQVGPPSTGALPRRRGGTPALVTRQGLPVHLFRWEALGRVLGGPGQSSQGLSSYSAHHSTSCLGPTFLPTHQSVVPFLVWEMNH